MNNPLLAPFGPAPFDQISNEHFIPAFDALIARSMEEIEAIANQEESPTFENTVVALERSGEQLNRVTELFFNLNSAETNEGIQKIAQEVSPKLSKFKNDLLLHGPLFERVKAVFLQRDQLDLDPEQQTLLEKQYKGFARNGADLNSSDQERLRAIDAQLSKLSLTFGEHVLAETNAYSMHLTDPIKLEGLPEGVKEAAAHLAKERGLDGWVFTLDYPSYVPFMKYAADRELRKELSLAFGSRAFKGNDQDNRQIVLDIVRLRHQRATLLGYPTHAHFVLEQRMAKNPETVNTFLADLLEKAKPAAKHEFEEMEAYAQKRDGIDRLERWDGAYYAEKIKKERFDLDDEALKPYFPLEAVIQGVFEVSKRLFGLHFEAVEGIPVYHEDVLTYKVLNEAGEEVSLLYADFHPRPGKRGGAWMTSYKSQHITAGVNHRPHVSIVCNFTKPTPSKPSLLSFNEVTTLFHEFGHALHGMLANTVYPHLSGTNVHWDFVELPSQLMENWCYEAEALALFAKHYQTGEMIPQDLIDKIKKASNFHEGMFTLRQLSFGMLDMAWHGADPSSIEDVESFEDQAFGATKLYPDVPGMCMSAAFSHIFQGGYSAGYYSYKWAEVLDADAFDHFKEVGIFDPEVSRKFKEHVLSKGGTEDPMELYVRFRGKRPTADALLKRSGLLAQ